MFFPPDCRVDTQKVEMHPECPIAPYFVLSLFVRFFILRGRTGTFDYWWDNTTIANSDGEANSNTDGIVSKCEVQLWQKANSMRRLF